MTTILDMVEQMKEYRRQSAAVPQDGNGRWYFPGETTLGAVDRCDPGCDT
jgi:hypothetical protein